MSKKTENSSDSLEIFKRLFPYIRPHRFRLAIGILCGMLYGATSFAMLIALRWVLGGISGEDLGNMSGILSLGKTDGAVADGAMADVEFGRVVFVAVLLPIIALAQGVVFFGGKYLIEWVGHRVVANLRGDLFNHIHALPMQFFSKSRVGDLISRITSDTTLLTYLVSNVIGDVIREPFTLIGCIAAMFWMDWKLALIALVVLPVCILPIALLGRRIRKASKGGQECLGDMLSVVQETVGGAEVVKAFQMEVAESERFNRSNNGVFKFYMRQSRSDSLAAPFVEFVSAFGIVGIVVYAYQHNISLAVLVTFAAAMVQSYKPVKKISQIHIRMQKAAPGVERVFEILDIANTIDDAPDAVAFNEPVRTVDFCNVSFAYDQTKTILDEVNLKSRAGQCIAFVGSSGAGKTTLVNLIPRFFDVTGGRIELNGTDIRNYTVHSLRSQIGVVTQETMLFNRSVADNIAYGSPHASRELIEDAARRANAHKFIMELENGYDTVIGERGSLLSGGMAQRVAIARALLKNPPILILDEATSALDTESERLVQGALDELMKDRTVFVIAHRLSTIAHADAIVVLDKGKIVEQGTHAELLAQGGKYKYLYDIQFSNASD
ncbi:MAG: ABC transporter ATP-binding protein [Pontiellaceae bacterium]|nr:ABC transporter ATP-binding protein [Pontiellaceae bacterium]